MQPLQNNLIAYRAIFVFENNLRRFIKSELEKVYGPTWFTKIDPSIQQDSQSQKQQMIKYLTTDLMDANPLNYNLFGPLRRIVLNFWANIFKNFFSNADKDPRRAYSKVEAKLFEIEIMRNFLMHNNLTNTDFLTQLEANINFFKTYIPQYDETIYSTASNDHILKIGGTVKAIVDIIKKRENIPIGLFENANKDIDPDILLLLRTYNSIPKTRDKRNSLTDFLSNSCLLQKLSLFNGDQ